MVEWPKDFLGTIDSFQFSEQQAEAADVSSSLAVAQETAEAVPPTFEPYAEIGQAAELSPTRQAEPVIETAADGGIIYQNGASEFILV